MSHPDPYVCGPLGSGSGSVSQRYGSVSVPKCHGSATLVKIAEIDDCSLNHPVTADEEVPDTERMNYHHTVNESHKGSLAFPVFRFQI
jgi:hypothetical protein